MELVYLWVENYKNIKKQGFNFSPRFTCKYDEATQELTIDENKDYVSIFPDNINITAIVGENGSGKSNVINCIRDILYSKQISKNGLDFKYIMIFNFADTLKLDLNFELNSHITRADEFEIFDFYLYLASEQQLTPRLILEENTYEKKDTYHLFALNTYAIGKMITNKYISEIDFQLTTFMYLPKQIKTKLKLQHIYNDLIEKYERESYQLPFATDLKGLSDKEEDRVYRDARNQSLAKKDDLENLFESIHDDFHRFLIVLYIENFGDENYYEFENKSFLLNELNESWYEITEEEFNQYFKDDTKDIDKFSQREKDIFFNYYKDFFNFDFIDSKERMFNDLSHGEQTIFGQMLNIYYYSLQNKKDLIFIFDEPDLALHPEWQRKYLKELENLLINIDKKFQILVTSHSPFILSDLPKENIIFLEKGKQEYPFKENEQTFGANIHTLLSHGFFMKDGLMGEFAKGKINKVISTLKKDTLSKDEISTCKNIISIIGEPILQKTLEHQLNEKLNSNESELERLQREQKEIQEKINKLKANSETN